MRSKYGNRKSGGFDSKKEARRAAELQMLEKAGRIRDLRYQVQFELIPSQKDAAGKVIERPVSYFADFTYFDIEAFVVEDCKGIRTMDYIIKRKLMLQRYGVRILET